MQLTRAADYAVRVMIHLAALPPGTRANRETIAGWSEVPAEFLSKVLQTLTRARLIQSHRGVAGGFELARPAASINMLQIIEAVEGPMQLNMCLGQESSCGRSWWCAAHSVWQNAQSAMIEVLSSATIDRLAEESFGKRNAAGLSHVESGGAAWS